LWIFKQIHNIWWKYPKCKKNIKIYLINPIPGNPGPIYRKTGMKKSRDPGKSGTGNPGNKTLVMSRFSPISKTVNSAGRQAGRVVISNLLPLLWELLPLLLTLLLLLYHDAAAAAAAVPLRALTEREEKRTLQQLTPFHSTEWMMMMMMRMMIIIHNT
jgi:hypothetical protein